MGPGGEFAAAGAVFFAGVGMLTVGGGGALGGWFAVVIGVGIGACRLSIVAWGLGMVVRGEVALAGAGAGFLGTDGGDPLGDRNLETFGGFLRVVEIGEGDSGEALVDGAFDGAEIGLFIVGDEGEGVADGRGAAGAADAVDVIFGDVRAVEVDDVGDACDVDAAGGDVGGDQDAVAADLKPSRAAVRWPWERLPWMGMQEMPLVGEVLGEAVGAVLGAGEADDGFEFLALQEFFEQGGFEMLRDGIDGLRDADGGRGLAIDLEGDGVLEHFVRELADFRRHGGGEEEGLAPGGQDAQDAADVGEEAHVEHAVGFVEDEDFQAVQAGVGLAEMIEEPAGGGDEDFGAGAEGVGLLTHAHAADDGGAGDGGVRGHEIEVFEDLGGQFARGA